MYCRQYKADEARAAGTRPEAARTVAGQYWARGSRTVQGRDRQGSITTVLHVAEAACTVAI